VLDALGLPDDLLRNVAIATLLVFGVVLLVPRLSATVEGWISGHSSRFAPKVGQGDGFWSGTVAGASLGFVYAPCAGPILAGVITVSAAQPLTAGRLAVAFAYALGSGLVLYVLMLGGRRLTGRLGSRTPQLQAAMGAVMIVFALIMAGQYDLRFQNEIADNLPAVVVNPTSSLESGEAAQEALARIRGTAGSPAAQRIADGVQAAGDGEGSGSGSRESGLPVIAPAPEFAGTGEWFNTPGGAPLTMSGLRGRVVLVDFWTYSCVNCIRTQPYLKAWDARYRDRGLTIVGVHSPEFPFEKDAGNVREAIERAGLKYPVVQDNEFGTWNAYANQYWPAEYFVDASGRIRYSHFGEGEYEEKERVIRELLSEAGLNPGKGDSGASGETISSGVTTPESYLGSARADRFTNGFILLGVRDFGSLRAPPADQLSFGGEWTIETDYARSRGGSVATTFGAKKVFLVLGSPGRPREVRLELDGRPVTAREAGTDVTDSALTVKDQRLYELIDLPESGKHTLVVSPDEGVEAYAFTFG
jgi:thiol-disulfide isomerase/thioredoxin